MSERRGKYSAYATEAQLQCLIVDWLRLHGYTVIETGQYKQSQRAVNTVGTPDIFVTRTGQNGRWYAIELKTRTGRIRQEQALLVADGVSNVCRSLEDVQRLLGEEVRHE